MSSFTYTTCIIQDALPMVLRSGGTISALCTLKWMKTSFRKLVHTETLQNLEGPEMIFEWCNVSLACHKTDDRQKDLNVPPCYTCTIKFRMCHILYA